MPDSLASSRASLSWTFSSSASLDVVPAWEMPRWAAILGGGWGRGRDGDGRLGVGGSFLSFGGEDVKMILQGIQKSENACEVDK